MPQPSDTTRRPASTEPGSRGTPLCLDCAYPLSGLKSRRCSECGRAFDPRDPTTFRRSGELSLVKRVRRRRTRITLGWLCALGGLVMTLIGWPIAFIWTGAFAGGELTSGWFALVIVLLFVLPMICIPVGLTLAHVER